MSLTDRPTVDLLMLIFAVVIGLAVLLAGAGVFIVEIAHPEIDTSTVVTSMGHVFDVLIGLLVGWVAGRRPRRRINRLGEDSDD